MVARLWLCGHRVADSEADRVVSGSVRGAGVCDGREHKWVEAIYDHGGQLGSERILPGTAPRESSIWGTRSHTTCATLVSLN